MERDSSGAAGGSLRSMMPKMSKKGGGHFGTRPLKKVGKLAVQKWGVGIRRPPFVTIRGELPAIQAMNIIGAIRGSFEAILGHVLGKKGLLGSTFYF